MADEGVPFVPGVVTGIGGGAFIRVLEGVPSEPGVLSPEGPLLLTVVIRKEVVLKDVTLPYN